jgi:hypothetical protein
VCSRVLCLVCANPLEEVAGPALLKETHQRRTQRLASIRGNLGDGGLGSSALLNVAAGDLLELKVLCDVGGNEDVGEFTVGHQKLGDEVDVPVVDATVLLPWLASGLTVLFEKGLDVQGSGLAETC